MIVKIVPDRSVDPDGGTLYYECKFLAVETKTEGAKVITTFHMNRGENSERYSPSTPCYVYLMENGKTIDSYWVDDRQVVGK